MNDRWAALAALALLALLFIHLFEGWSFGAFLGLVVLLVAPFAILLRALARGGLRTSRGWERDEQGAPEGRDAP